MDSCAFRDAALTYHDQIKQKFDIDQHAHNWLRVRADSAVFNYELTAKAHPRRYDFGLRPSFDKLPTFLNLSGRGHLSYQVVKEIPGSAPGQEHRMGNGGDPDSSPSNSRRF